MHPLQFLDAVPDLLQIDSEYIRTDVEPRSGDDLIFLDSLQSGHGELFDFKPWSYGQVSDTRVESPANHRTACDHYRNLGESDEFRYFHAVLENRSESVSETLVMFPAPITTTASPSLAFAMM